MQLAPLRIHARVRRDRDPKIAKKRARRRKIRLRIPATSRRNPTKISDPGGPPELPESVRDPSGTRPSEENAKKRFPAAKKSNVGNLRDRFLAIFGSRPGAQNRQKTRPEAKKRVRRRRRKRFLSFFLAVAVRSRSPDRFSDGPTLENRVIS